ncbi:hypothetical protein [Maridesulfovibrio salexigens]|uniref:Permuted papain-like amidase enzyme, YaeF/YiiX, C92 family n=1 Tax=Maridesulfovibrio salexigens (strain ATCC 14822 / DSM 2638 / NCIMB 8403 / VKM B-1763) TaxID=526222 RepID=C6C1Q4_MARSD|nr:hypothetical protein [Maridesulfovibrio salexigens]ACS79300.1 hypothetical protein Desal_1237 [Maridesulfovibrio salexigens DSM 2638]
MDIQKLKAGDVLLFSAEKGSFISWVITFLTDAQVSHAAMFYDVPEQLIIEESPPQVAINKAFERFKGREITVRRLKEELPMVPVIKVAKAYLNDDEPYDQSGLYLVGLLLLYRKFTPSSAKQRVMIRIFKKITASIVDYIHKHQSPGKEPMVCSQFVAQCYANAGPEYKLKFKKGLLQKSATAQLEDKNLIEQVLQRLDQEEPPQTQRLLQSVLEPEKETFLSGEDLCQELKEAFLDESDIVSVSISDEFTEAVAQFAYAHHLATTGQAVELSGQNVPQLLRDLNDYENMFTTPGDLLKSCESLESICVIK